MQHTYSYNPISSSSPRTHRLHACLKILIGRVELRSIILTASSQGCSRCFLVGTTDLAQLRPFALNTLDGCICFKHHNTIAFSNCLMVYHPSCSIKQRQKKLFWFTPFAKWDHIQETGIVPETEPDDVHRQHYVGRHLPMSLLYGDFSRLSYLPAH